MGGKEGLSLGIIGIGTQIHLFAAPGNPLRKRLGIEFARLNLKYDLTSFWGGALGPVDD